MSYTINNQTAALSHPATENVLVSVIAETANDMLAVPSQKSAFTERQRSKVWHIRQPNGSIVSSFQSECIGQCDSRKRKR